MAKNSKRVSELASVARPSPNSSESKSTDADLDLRLERLCVKFGFASDDKYFLLSRNLLTELDRVLGFQTFDKQLEGNDGAPVTWTMKRHIALVKFVNDCLKKGDNTKTAIRQAWKASFEQDSQGKKQTLTAVRAEYFRAKRFIESAPLIAAAMGSANREPRNRAAQAFVAFVGRTANVHTAYGEQPIAADHLQKFKKKDARSNDQGKKTRDQKIS